MKSRRFSSLSSETYIGKIAPDDSVAFKVNTFKYFKPLDFILFNYNEKIATYHHDDLWLDSYNLKVDTTIALYNIKIIHKNSMLKDESTIYKNGITSFSKNFLKKQCKIIVFGEKLSIISQSKKRIHLKGKICQLKIESNKKAFIGFNTTESKNRLFYIDLVINKNKNGWDLYLLHKSSRFTINLKTLLNDY